MSERSSSIHCVAFADTDAGGIVYHARYLEIAERSRNELVQRTGFSLRQIRDELGVLLVVHRLKATYRLAAMLEDRLEIESVLTRVDAVKTRWQTEIRRTDQLLCTIDAEVVCVSADRKQLCPVPYALFERLEALAQGTPVPAPRWTAERASRLRVVVPQPDIDINPSESPTQ